MPDSSREPRAKASAAEWTPRRPGQTGSNSSTGSRVRQTQGSDASDRCLAMECDEQNESEALVEFRRKDWDRKAATYDHNPCLQWHKNFAREIITWQPIFAGARVLDLACGTGEYALLASQRVGRKGTVWAIDSSPGMLARLKAKKAAAMPQSQNLFSFKNDVVDLSSLKPLQDLLKKDGRFHMLTCFACLNLLPDPQKHLQDWSRVLIQGGNLVVDFPSPATSLLHVLSEIEESLGLEPYETQLGADARTWTHSAIKSIFDNTGFKITHIVTTGDLMFPREKPRKFRRGDGDAFFGVWAAIPDLIRRFGREQVKSKFDQVWNRYTSQGQSIPHIFQREVVFAVKS